MAPKDTLEDLRKQIKENAELLFPSALEEFGTKNNGNVSAKQAFKVVVVQAIFEPAKGYQYQAILMTGPLNARRDAANATAKDTTEEALQNLLDLTGQALHKKRMDGESEVSTDAQGQSKELETFEVGWVSKTLS